MMNRSLLIGLACMVMCISAPQAEREPSAKFVAHLSGQNEVPPVETRGQGQVKVTVSNDGTEVKFRINVARTENITQAHIHCAGPDANGPVAVFLLGFISGGVTLNGVLVQGSFDTNDIIPVADSAACPGGISDLDDLVEAMYSGQTYVNVHTLANPPGEIRGQLSAAD